MELANDGLVLSFLGWAVAARSALVGTLGLSIAFLVVFRMK